MTLKQLCQLSLILIALVSASRPVQAAGVRCAAVLSQADLAPQLNTYLSDTLKSLEQMRGENGLVSDAIRIRQKADDAFTVETINPNTSPTNIAVDLLIQTEISSRPEFQKSAEEHLAKAISTLSQAQFHADTGLFYSRYTTDASTRVTDLAVSSIDNLHLAIALWTVKETFPKTEFGRQAGQLFQRMNFSVYYDEARGVIGGNLRHDNSSGTSTWIKETYNFDNLGSEARLLYSAGWAMGLFRDIKNDSTFVQKAISAIGLEVHPSPQGNLLKLWDGSAFQLFFPKMFINEEQYSPQMNSFYQAAGNFMLSEGERRKLNTPAAHSAGWVAFQLYRDKAGNISLVSSSNSDVNEPHMRKDWDATFTPYALFMAATSNPQKIMPIFKDLQNIQSGSNSLYLTNMGWMDGYHIKGSKKGKVVNAQLSLNQGMLALSLLQMQSADGLSPSARQLSKNANIKQRLQYFYRELDKKISQAFP